ncbi:hypothetical protein OCAR_6783 [Afipia carboxidovorans OM5]|nr:hypothetical protein OCAR_6783 [Afipia carboxidovorans OM5]
MSIRIYGAHAMARAGYWDTMGNTQVRITKRDDVARDRVRT